MPDLEAGAASVDATPHAEHIDNSLHSIMRVAEGVYGAPLHAKALVLRMGSTSGLLLTLDLVYLHRAHCDLLRARLAAATGIPAEAIVVHCTHSHSTPFAEDLEGPHPYFDLVSERAELAARQAIQELRPAQVGFGQTHVAGASYNTQLPLDDGGVKFVRDYREGLASGRPVDPRLSVIRIDDSDRRPIAGWVRFAAHPSVVIFDAPISAEYSGYLTDRLEATVTAGAPMCFNVGACGDVNPVPMFGTEADCQRLGENLAELAAPVFERIETAPAQRFGIAEGAVELPLDAPPSSANLDAEIAELDAYFAGLDTDPSNERVMGVNVLPEWPVEHKRDHFAPVREWAVRMKQALADGLPQPQSWASPLQAWVIDGVGLLFYGGEPFVELSLAIAARSSLDEALLMPMGNGSDGYVTTDAGLRRGGYEAYTSVRYSGSHPDRRPLPYAHGASDQLVDAGLALLAQAERES